MTSDELKQTTAGNATTKDVAADEAKDLARTTQDTTSQVAGTAADEARQLAGEARGHAQGLLHEARTEATTQLFVQQQRLAGSLRSISGELDTMAHAADAPTAAGLVSQAAGQVERAAGWLENREPADVLAEVRRYARRNPGTFLAGAALVGLIGGRVTRGLQAEADRREDEQRHQGYRPVATDRTYVASAPAAPVYDRASYDYRPETSVVSTHRTDADLRGGQVTAAQPVVRGADEVFDQETAPTTPSSTARAPFDPRAEGEQSGDLTR